MKLSAVSPLCLLSSTNTLVRPDILCPFIARKMQETHGSIPGLGRSSGREWIPTPIFLPGEFHGERTLAGDSSWVAKNWTWLSGYRFHYSKKTDLFKTLRKLLTATQLSGGGLRIQAKLSASEACAMLFPHPPVKLEVVLLVLLTFQGISSLAQFVYRTEKNGQTFHQSHWRVSKLEGFITRSISKDSHSWLTMGWQLDNQFQLHPAREQCLPPSPAGTLGQILKPLSIVIALAIGNPLEKRPCTLLENLGKRNLLRKWGAGIFVKQNH